MPNKPVTWSTFCKNRSRLLILVLQRWAATQEVVAVVAVMAVVVVIVGAVAADILPAILLHLAEADGKQAVTPKKYAFDDRDSRYYCIIHLFLFRRDIT
jgi:hypothetical protein